MEQGRVFKQPFRKSITFRTLFYSVFWLFIALIECLVLYKFHFYPFSWKCLIALIPLSIICICLIYLGLSLFFCSNYVVLYEDRLLCINRFFSFLSTTYLFIEYQYYRVVIYPHSPYARPLGTYGMICFCRPGKKWWKMKDYYFLASVSAEDCKTIGLILKDMGFNVEIYDCDYRL